MIVGFNHNITYRGVSFHVQTEDSGLQKPQLVSLLYHGGTIISSQKTLYEDILKVENLEQVVENLAKEQHKGMLKRLTSGAFDERIIDLGIPLGAVSATEKPEEAMQSATGTETTSEEVVSAGVQDEILIVEEPVVDKFRQSKTANEPSLDELILAYLTAGRDST